MQIDTATAPPLLIPEADLSHLNTLAAPATAAYMARVQSPEELQQLLLWRRQGREPLRRDMPIYVLGGGSNSLLPEYFPGLVIQMAINEREWLQEDDDHVWLKLGAGVDWPDLVRWSLQQGWYGLENLAMIPGTVGAAPIQNIGAYGVELCDLLEELHAVDIASGLPVTFDCDGCGFGYRDSVFKGALAGRYVITSVVLKLHFAPLVQADYPALAQTLAASGIDDPTPEQVFEAVCQVRSSKLPDPAEIPNVGSFFQNPIVERAHFQRLKVDHPDLVGFDAGDDQVKLAAGWMIEQCGWKGAVEAGVGVHDRQALVLINPGKRPCREVLALAAKIRTDVQACFGVSLDIEPRSPIGAAS